MALVETSLPSLINGVSQQSPHLRRSSQCEEQVNAIADPVKGLRPRYPSIVTAQLPSTGLNPNNIVSHLINRDEDERYKLVVSDTTLKVFDLFTGQEAPVTFEASSDYLSSSSSRDSLKFLTIADTTFIVNSETAVLPKAATSTHVEAQSVLFHVRKGDYSTTYNIKLDDGVHTFTGSHVTDAPTTTGADNTQNKQATRTDLIAGALFSELEDGIRAQYGSPSLEVEYINGIGVGYYEWVTANHTLRMYQIETQVVFEIYGGSFVEADATDSLGDTGVKVAFRKVQKLTDLPERCQQGFIMKVDGQEVESGDEYYVRYAHNSWEETTASDEGIDETTAPHVLVKQPNGSFIFKAVDWNKRTVGSTESNPLPSFINQKIADVFFFKDRLGFVSDENIILSEVGEPYNFFRTTMLQLLDSDPIDVSMNDDQIAQLRFALPFDDELVVFSDSAQFTVGGEGLLSPSTINSDVTTRFEVDTAVKPKGIGRSVFFAQPYGKSGKVLEYYVDSEAKVKDAADVTAHCPHYIHGRLHWLSASTTNNMVAALTEDKEDSIYIYHFFWQGNEKVQSSWSRWEFPNFKVISCDFLENKLHILFYHQETDSYFLEYIDITNSYLQSQNNPYISDIRLDHLELHDGIASVGNSPLNGTTDWEIVASDNVVYTDVNSVPVQADVTYHSGTPLNFSYTFSEFVVPAPSRGQDVSALRGRLQLKNLLINFSDSAKFDVEVAIENRDLKTKSYDARLVGSGNVVFNDIARTQGEFSVPIKSEASKVKITLKNSAYLPCAFHGVEWEGWYHQRARRI